MKLTALAGGLVAGQSVTKTALAGLPELVSQNSADTQDPSARRERTIQPSCNFERVDVALADEDGVKEFHLVAGQ